MFGEESFPGATRPFEDEKLVTALDFLELSHELLDLYISFEGSDLMLQYIGDCFFFLLDEYRALLEAHAFQVVDVVADGHNAVHILLVRFFYSYD